MFSIYDFDRFSKHDQIGQVLLPLGKIDLGQVIEEWKDIAPPPDDKEAVSIMLYYILNNDVVLLLNKFNF